MEREYWECRICSYGVSGPVGSGLDRKIDAHEDETGHRMALVREEDEFR